jgi:hypothetical protein
MEPTLETLENQTASATSLQPPQSCECTLTEPAGPGRLYRLDTLHNDHSESTRCVNSPAPPPP